MDARDDIPRNARAFKRLLSLALNKIRCLFSLSLSLIRYRSENMFFRITHDTTDATYEGGRGWGYAIHEDGAAEDIGGSGQRRVTVIARWLYACHLTILELQIFQRNIWGTARPRWRPVGMNGRRAGINQSSFSFNKQLPDLSSSFPNAVSTIVRQCHCR